MPDPLLPLVDDRSAILRQISELGDFLLAPFRDCTAPVGLTVRQKWGFSRGDAGGGTPSEGVWGNAPSWRGRGSYSTPDSKFFLAQA